MLAKKAPNNNKKNFMKTNSQSGFVPVHVVIQFLSSTTVDYFARMDLKPKVNIFEINSKLQSCQQPPVLQASLMQNLSKKIKKKYIYFLKTKK